MNERHARDLIDFAARWAPFGGADDEEIWVSFGLRAGEYRRRLRLILDLPNPALLDNAMRERLRICSRRLNAAPRPLVGL